MQEKKAKKVGSQGFKIELKANYVALELQDGCCISEYRVRFQPQVDEVLLRHKYLNEHCQLKDSPKLFNGEKLLVPNLPHLEALTSEDGTTSNVQQLFSLWQFCSHKMVFPTKNIDIFFQWRLNCSTQVILQTQAGFDSLTSS